MNMKFKGIFRLWPSIAQCEGRGASSCVVALLRDEGDRRREVPVEVVGYKNNHVSSAAVTQAFAKLGEERPLLEGGKKTLADFPFWGEVYPKDYRKCAAVFVKDFFKETRADSPLSLLRFQERVLEYGLTKEIVEEEVFSLAAREKIQKSGIKKDLERIKFCSLNGAAVEKPSRSFWTKTFRCFPLFLKL